MTTDRFISAWLCVTASARSPAMLMNRCQVLWMMLLSATLRWDRIAVSATVFSRCSRVWILSTHSRTPESSSTSVLSMLAASLRSMVAPKRRNSPVDWIIRGPNAALVSAAGPASVPGAALDSLTQSTSVRSTSTWTTQTHHQTARLGVRSLICTT